MAPKKKTENSVSPEKTPRKRTTKIKYTIQQEDFRTTINPDDIYKLKMTTSQGNRVIVTENVSKIVDAIKKAKQSEKSIIQKLKDAVLNFFQVFKR